MTSDNDKSRGNTAWTAAKKPSDHQENQSSRWITSWAPKIGMFLACLGVLLYLSYLSIHKFSLRETATGDKYEHLTQVSFPELTLCPSVPYRRDVLRKNGINDVYDLQFKAEWVSDDSEKPPLNFFNEIIIPLDEIYHSARVDLEQSLGNETQLYLNGTVIDNCPLDPIWVSKEYYFNGICYAMLLPDCLKKHGVLELILYFKQATDVFVHHPSQFLSPNSRSRVKLKTTSQSRKIVSFKIAATYEIVHLDSSTGKCVDMDKFDECMYGNLYKIQMNELGCTVPWLKDKNNICAGRELRKEAFKLYQNNRRNQQKICENPCQFTNVYFGPPVEEILDSHNDAKCTLVVYFRRDVKVTSEYYLISVISMIAEIGGYASLLLGFSLYNLTDLSDYFAEKWRFLKEHLCNRSYFKYTK